MKKLLTPLFFLAILFSQQSLAETSPSEQEEKTGLQQLLVNYLAKELCSCYYVVEQSEAICKESVKQIPGIATIKILRGIKQIEVSNYFASGKAKWISDKKGCKLEL